MAKKPTVIVSKLVDESLANDKLTALKNLFPEVMTEVKDDDGKIVYGIDVEKLAEAVSGKAVEKFETYGLNWIGKSQCIALSKEAPAGALRPCVEDSVNFNETENVYIEGDNLEVLKLLRSTYKGKIKMIYIDPPYNTGNDFIYKDNFKMPIEQYKLITGQKDEDGNKLTTEKETAGYRHSDWLNMMYPRLKIAKELLTDDGVIFISIDDNEIANLKKICDDIFLESNFVGTITWLKKRKGSFLSKKIISVTEYIVVYAKNNQYLNGLYGGIPDEAESQPLIKRTNALSILEIPKNTISTRLDDGVYKAGMYGENTNPVELLNDMIVKNNMISNTISIRAPFVWSQQKLDEQIKKGARLVINTMNMQLRVYRVYEEHEHKGLSSVLDGIKIQGTNEDAYEELQEIFQKIKVFDYSKPSNFLVTLLMSATYFDKDSIILDFFSGSATTAHAVMQLNAEDDGNRKFIMVQLPEETPESSEAYKAGYKNICEIGKERIRRAGKRIKEEYPDKNIDTGFRVYKLDSSNINEEIFKKPHEISLETLTAGIIKEDRTDLDLLTQVMLENSIELSASIKVEQIDGHKVYSVDNDYLIACFDTDIKEETFKKLLQKENVALIALKEPINDSFLTNVNVLKMQYNPDVEVRVFEYGI